MMPELTMPTTWDLVTNWLSGLVTTKLSAQSPSSPWASADMKSATSRALTARRLASSASGAVATTGDADARLPSDDTASPITKTRIKARIGYSPRLGQLLLGA